MKIGHYGSGDSSSSCEGAAGLPGVRLSALLALTALGLAGFTALVRGATEARITLLAHEANAKVFINGSPVEMTQGAASLSLRKGVNILAIEAQAEGESAWVRPAIEARGRTLMPVWSVAPQMPAENWRTAPPEPGWAAAVRRGEGIWSRAGQIRTFL